MNRAKVLAITVPLFAAQLLVAQTTMPVNSMQVKPDREREGLHGPVKSCTTENSRPAVTDAQGTTFPEIHWANTTEFDLQGRNVLTRHENSDRSGCHTVVAGSEAPAPSLPSYSEARYSYQYDSFGNWTEQSVSYRNSPDEAFLPSSTTKRTLTYY